MLFIFLIAGKLIADVVITCENAPCPVDLQITYRYSPLPVKSTMTTMFRLCLLLEPRQYTETQTKEVTKLCETYIGQGAFF